MSIDLSAVAAESKKGEGGYAFRAGIDAEKTAQLLEQMAAQLRATNIIPTKCSVTSEFVSGDWERGRLVLEFNEKVFL